MKKILFILLFIPVICFGQNRMMSDSSSYWYWRGDTFRIKHHINKFVLTGTDSIKIEKAILDSLKWSTTKALSDSIDSLRVELLDSINASRPRVGGGLRYDGDTVKLDNGSHTSNDVIDISTNQYAVISSDNADIVINPNSVQMNVFGVNTSNIIFIDTTGAYLLKTGQPKHDSLSIPKKGNVLGWISDSITTNKLKSSQSIKVGGDSVYIGDTIFKKITFKTIGTSNHNQYNKTIGANSFNQYNSTIGNGAYNQYNITTGNSAYNQYNTSTGLGGYNQYNNTTGNSTHNQNNNTSGISAHNQYNTTNGVASYNQYNNTYGNNSPNIYSKTYNWSVSQIINSVKADTVFIIKKNDVNKMLIRGNGRIFKGSDSIPTVPEVALMIDDSVQSNKIDTTYLRSDIDKSVKYTDTLPDSTLYEFVNNRISPEVDLIKRSDHFYPSTNWVNSLVSDRISVLHYNITKPEQRSILFQGDSRFSRYNPIIKEYIRQNFTLAGEGFFPFGQNGESILGTNQRYSICNKVNNRCLTATTWGTTPEKFGISGITNVIYPTSYIDIQTERPYFSYDTLRVSHCQIFFRMGQDMGSFKYEINNSGVFDTVICTTTGGIDSLGYITILNPDTAKLQEFKVKIYGNSDSCYMYGYRCWNAYVNGIIPDFINLGGISLLAQLQSFRYVKQFIKLTQPTQVHFMSGVNDKATPTNFCIRQKAYIDSIRTEMPSYGDIIVYTPWQRPEPLYSTYSSYRDSIMRLKDYYNISVLDCWKYFPTRTAGDSMGVWNGVIHISDIGNNVLSKAAIKIICPGTYGATKPDRSNYFNNGLYVVDGAMNQSFKYNKNGEKLLNSGGYLLEDTFFKVKNALVQAELITATRYGGMVSNSLSGIPYSCADSREFDLDSCNATILLEFTLDKNDMSVPSYISKVILNKWGSSGSYSYKFQKDSSNLVLYYSTDGTTISKLRWTSIFPEPSNGEYYFVVLRKIGQTVELHINGESKGIKTLSGNIYTSTNPFYLEETASNGRWMGKIINLSFVNYALTNNDLKLIYNPKSSNYDYLRSKYGYGRKNGYAYTFATTHPFSTFHATVTANIDGITDRYGETLSDNCRIYATSTSSHFAYITSAQYKMKPTQKYLVKCKYFLRPGSGTITKMSLGDASSGKYLTVLNKWTQYQDTVEFLAIDAGGLSVRPHINFNFFAGTSSSFTAAGNDTSDCVYFNSFQIIPIGINIEYRDDEQYQSTWLDHSGNGNNLSVQTFWKGENMPGKNMEVCYSDKFYTNIQSGTANLDMYIPFGYLIEKITTTNYQPTTNLTSFTAIYNGVTIISSMTINAANTYILPITATYPILTSGSVNYIRFNCVGNATEGMSIMVYLKKLY
jgi:hypothetical protein